jgi:hypothetical protein
MVVSSHLFEAFLECPTKCWLRSRAEPTAGNAYAEWAQAQNKAYCERGNTQPDVVLNRHCGQCEFQARCRKQAMDKDELSLLSRMSEKERKKLHGKGIFTITQLSYTFRPRRRHRKSLRKQEKFHHSLQALAIRKNKIHAVDLLDPTLEGTPVYLDVEGLPDCESYYLIGIRVGTGDAGVQYSFWANDSHEEKRIWNDFLSALSTIPNPSLIHYGNYETVFLNRMRKRHGEPGEDSAVTASIKNATNLNSFIFAHLFSDFLKWIKGHRRISRIPMVRLAGVWARSDRSAASLGSIQGSRGETGAPGVQPAGLQCARNRGKQACRIASRHVSRAGVVADQNSIRIRH